jgi:hypothetical protein
MKIIKYTDYIKEAFEDTPETLAEQALKSIRKKIMDIFPEEEEEESEDEVISFSQAKKRGEEKEEKSKKITFADYGTKLVDADISRLASSLTCKLDDGDSIYTIIFFIDLKDAIQKDPSKDFSLDDIENCKIKIKKFKEGEEPRELPKKTVKITDIDEEELIKLKIEIDGDDTEELVIETE